MKWNDREGVQERLVRTLTERKFKVRSGSPIRGYWQLRIPFRLTGGQVSKLSQPATIIDVANDIRVNPGDLSIKTVKGITNVDLLLDTTDRTVVSVNDRPKHWPYKLADFYETKGGIPPLESRPQNPMGFWVGAGFVGWVSVQINIPTEPHLLVTGMSGSGKSMFLVNILDQIMDRNSSVKLYCIDPNRVLGLADNLPHLVAPRAQTIEDGRKLILGLAEKLDTLTGYPNYIVMVDELTSVLGGAPAPVKDAWGAIVRQGRGLGMWVIGATQKALAENVGSDARAQFSWRAIGSCSNDEEFRMTVGNRRIIPHRIPSGGAFYIYRVQSQHGVNVRAPYLSDEYIERRFQGAKKVVSEIPEPVSGGSLRNFSSVVRWVREQDMISQNDLMVHLRDAYGKGSVTTAREYKNRLIEQGVISETKNKTQKHVVMQ